MSPDDIDLDREYAEGWRPEPEDRVVGKITDISSGWSDESNSYYPIVTVHDELTDKEIALHAFHAVLRNKLEEYQPVVGDRIGVKYEGKRPTKDGKREVAIYKVAVAGKSGFKWGQQQQQQSPQESTVAVPQVTETDAEIDEMLS